MDAIEPEPERVGEREDEAQGGVAGGGDVASSSWSPHYDLQEFRGQIRADLDRTVRFWMNHSRDVQCGGFFTCLGEDGQMYDDTKHCWLQCRQVWMYARLYNELDRFKTAEILDTAENGAKFIQTFVKRQDGTWKCYLTLTREGQPMKTQRTIFTECFYMLAMGELYRATTKPEYKEEAVGMLKQIIQWCRHDDTGLGREKLAGQTPVITLAVPMMLLYLTQEMTAVDPALGKDYEDTMQWCVDEILKHVQRNGSVVLENVSPDGKELPGSAGRLMNPGHAIEAGWFLLRRAQQTNDKTLQDTAIKTFILAPFRRGWDDQHGGLFYFLDADGLSPVQLQWSMKLWWPHSETLIALLMAYSVTKEDQLMRCFDTVFDYVYSHFVDKYRGEWYGYLDRQGEVTHRFKGGPWKGFFHVPRCLLMCETLLDELINQQLP